MPYQARALTARPCRRCRATPPPPAAPPTHPPRCPQAFKISISEDSNHAEAYSNLGVLELRKGNIDAARSNFSTAHGLAPHMFEPCFNGALLAFKLGDFQDSYELAQKSLAAFPDHHDSHELVKQLRTHFTML
jgi:tetratricopeptide repeat protein 8